jgi:hypothetical protein
MVSTGMYALKQVTHSLIDVILFSGVLGRFDVSTSISVGCGTPRRAGSKSTYSLRQNLLASFLGIGGECGPIETATLGSSLVVFGSKNTRGDCSDSRGLEFALVITVLAPDVALGAVMEADPSMPVNVVKSDSCVALGTLPRASACVAAEGPVK